MLIVHIHLRLTIQPPISRWIQTVSCQKMAKLNLVLMINESKQALSHPSKNTSKAQISHPTDEILLKFTNIQLIILINLMHIVTQSLLTNPLFGRQGWLPHKLIREIKLVCCAPNQ